MKYLSVAEAAKIWGISERSVRNYCQEGRVEGAFLTGKTWNIPEGSEKPAKLTQSVKYSDDTNLYSALRREKKSRLSGGIYYRVMIDLTYNTNHIEGSRLTEDQTRYIYETNSLPPTDDVIPVDDVIETVNHFRCVNLCIDCAKKPLSEEIIKEFHRTLKRGTRQADEGLLIPGGYKKIPNTVGFLETVPPGEVESRIRDLITEYCPNERHSLEDIVSFHVEFEKIHPFQDGNGRVGRLIMFKECLKNGVVPFIIDEYHRPYYIRGFSEWDNEKGFLLDTCRSAQDVFMTYMNYFGISRVNSDSPFPK